MNFNSKYCYKCIYLLQSIRQITLRDSSSGNEGSGSPQMSEGNLLNGGTDGIWKLHRVSISSILCPKLNKNLYSELEVSLISLANMNKIYNRRVWPVQLTSSLFFLHGGTASIGSLWRRHERLHFISPRITIIYLVQLFQLIKPSYLNTTPWILFVFIFFERYGPYQLLTSRHLHRSFGRPLNPCAW